MKKIIPFLTCLAFCNCISVPNPPVKNIAFEKQQADDQEKDFNLQVKTICFSEKNTNKEIEIEYELKNNSKSTVFDHKLKTYKLFFILKMTDGREIAKEKTIWSIIPPNTAIIEKEKIYISDYVVQSCSTTLYTKYR
ncbi:hypothetical protein [Flavobacterium sp. YO64]|uniref:hypothetical protein n=1 Tax=Flavobacterium sp. YO64 TaxID=394559 RepID=UPI00100B8C73|nr:hypothetical protein [Flavobacterium sp. YO64]RXM46385.1 hypothetical protein BOW57_01610 [Flavobacterium sp. YO64]